MLQLKGPQEALYSINFNTLLFFDDKNVVNSNTSYIWKFSTIEKRDFEHWVVELTIMDSSHTTEHDVLPTADFANLLNKPLEKLRLLLDYDGTIIKVLNKNEILQKWNLIKKDLEKRAENNQPELKNVINSSNGDFHNPTDRIKNSLLHFLFLSPVYFDAEKKMRVFRYPSVVNAGETLVNHTKQTLTSYNLDEYIFKLTCEHDDYGTTNLSKKYNRSLGTFLTAPVDYYFKFNSTNCYDKHTGLLKSIKAELKEHASSQFHHTFTINIEQKQNNI